MIFTIRKGDFFNKLLFLKKTLIVQKLHNHSRLEIPVKINCRKPQMNVLQVLTGAISPSSPSSSSWRFTTVMDRGWPRVRFTVSCTESGLSPGKPTRSPWASWPASTATRGGKRTTACWEVRLNIITWTLPKKFTQEAAAALKQKLVSSQCKSWWLLNIQVE